MGGCDCLPSLTGCCSEAPRSPPCSLLSEKTSSKLRNRRRHESLLIHVLDLLRSQNRTELRKVLTFKVSFNVSYSASFKNGFPAWYAKDASMNFCSSGPGPFEYAIQSIGALHLSGTPAGITPYTPAELFQSSRSLSLSKMQSSPRSYSE